MPVDEVASLTVATIVLLSEILTFLGFVLIVLLVIPQQLMRSVRELTFILKRTETLFHKLFAQLCLLLGIFERVLLFLSLMIVGQVFVIFFVGVGGREGNRGVIVEYLHH